MPNETITETLKDDPNRQGPGLRVGLNDLCIKWYVTDYVLSPFEDHEKETVQEAIERAAAAVCVVVCEGVESAMNIFNQKVKETPL